MKLFDRDDLIIVPATALAALLRPFPAAIRTAAARVLGTIAYQFSTGKRSRMERNVGAALGADRREERKIIRASLANVWREMFDLVAGRRACPPVERRKVVGLERLRRSHAAGRGVILWETNGLGPRAVPKRILGELGFPIRQVFGADHLGIFALRDAKGSWVRARVVRPFLIGCEKHFAADIAFLGRGGDIGPLRELRNCLSRNEIICVPADGPVGRHQVEVPFLGGRRAFPTGMISLAKATGATIVPMFSTRRPGDGCTVVIEEPLAVDADSDRPTLFRRALTRYATLLESYVRQYPEQYRKWHLVRPTATADVDDGSTRTVHSP